MLILLLQLLSFSRFDFSSTFLDETAVYTDTNAEMDSMCSTAGSRLSLLLHGSYRFLSFYRFFRGKSFLVLVTNAELSHDKS